MLEGWSTRELNSELLRMIISLSKRYGNYNFVVKKYSFKYFRKNFMFVNAAQQFLQVFVCCKAGTLTVKSDSSTMLNKRILL